jgi:hypothetical protein
MVNGTASSGGNQWKENGKAMANWSECARPGVDAAAAEIQ